MILILLYVYLKRSNPKLYSDKHLWWSSLWLGNENASSISNNNSVWLFSLDDFWVLWSMLDTKPWGYSPSGVRGLQGCHHWCSWGFWQGPGGSVSEDILSQGYKGSLLSGIWNWGRLSFSSWIHHLDSAAFSLTVLTTAEIWNCFWVPKKNR